jgi:hypothetical protein
MTYQTSTKTPDAFNAQLTQLKQKLKLPEKEILELAISELWVRVVGK